MSYGYHLLYQVLIISFILSFFFSIYCTRVLTISEPATIRILNTESFPHVSSRAFLFLQANPRNSVLPFLGVNCSVFVSQQAQESFSINLLQHSFPFTFLFLLFAVSNCPFLFYPWLLKFNQAPNDPHLISVSAFTSYTAVFSKLIRTITYYLIQETSHCISVVYRTMWELLLHRYEIPMKKYIINNVSINQKNGKINETKALD